MTTFIFFPPYSKASPQIALMVTPLTHIDRKSRIIGRHKLAPRYEKINQLVRGHILRRASVKPRLSSKLGDNRLS